MRIIKKRKKWGGSRGGDIAIFILLVLIGLFMLFPIYLSVIQSIKPVEELFVFPPKLYVQRPTSQNFEDMLKVAGSLDVPFSRYVFNSVFVSVAQLFLSSSAAYVLSKVKAPGVKAMNKVIEIALLFTSSVTYIVQYIVMAGMGMIDTYWAITLPYIATPMGLFLMKQFMGQIPESMIEAAKLDGASHLRVCWQIVMPNVKPAHPDDIRIPGRLADHRLSVRLFRAAQAYSYRNAADRSGRYCATGRIVSDSCCADAATYDTLPYSPE